MQLNYRHWVSVFFLAGLLLTSAACNDASKIRQISTYDKLCQIYMEIVPQPIDRETKEFKIAESVEKELPGFFEANFGHIITAKPSQRYQFIKRLAEEEMKTQWDCKVISSYYTDEFN